MPNKVFIVGPDGSVENLFNNWGWKIVKNMADSDLVQFTGGADISPAIYDQACHQTTHFNERRDKFELLSYAYAVSLEKPMAGICRGGQLLNVLCGGSMWQDVNNHGRTHWAYDTQTGEGLMVSSVHHQMMIPGPKGRVVLESCEATHKIKCGRPGSGKIDFNGGWKEDGPDPEAIVYLQDRAFCFQGHPEYTYAPDVDAWYMGYIEEFFGFKAVKSSHNRK